MVWKVDGLITVFELNNIVSTFSYIHLSLQRGLWNL